jgi:hypothetical protein
MILAGHALSLCGVLIFGAGGFILIWASDTERLSSTIRIVACALLTIGAALFVTGLLSSSDADDRRTFAPCNSRSC